MVLDWCCLQALTTQTYLCASDYDEPYFDFHCLPGGRAPSDGLDWYSVCGTPVANRAEYVVVVAAFVLLGLGVYVQMLAFSGSQPTGRVSARKKRD